MRIRYSGKTRRGRRHVYEVRAINEDLAWCPRRKVWSVPERGASWRSVRTCWTARAAGKAAVALLCQVIGPVQIVRSGRTPCKIWVMTR